MPVSVRLLGVPRIDVDGQASEPTVTKTYGLLCYLACHDGWVARADAATMFWGESPDERSRNNLSKLLSRNVSALAFVRLDVEPQRLRWNVACDVRDFRSAVADRDWARAFRTYAGDLMEGAYIPDAPLFEDWISTARGELRRAWRNAAFALAAQLAEADRTADATDVMARVRERDPLDEDALRAHVTHLARIGRSREARSAVAAFTKMLHEEVGGEPDDQTLELMATLDADALDSPLGADPKRDAPSHARRSLPLPQPATPFIGRTEEADALLDRLDDPTCRLVTIVGPGGMGKTRLAIAVAERVLARRGNDVAFVPLAAVATTEGIAFAMADALQVALVGRDDPWRQLADAIGDRGLLLVLDNLEQLIGRLSPVQELLQQCPAMRILATSRERLHVTSETVYRLVGLGRVNRSDAEELFVHHARRLRPEVGFSADDHASIRRICELVEGMPLAIVLAASWVDSIPLAEIARDLQRDLDLLSATAHDLPERHKSVRATFDASWRRLPERAQDVFTRLSVFRGGFSFPAAAEVADADRQTLRTLAAQSFLALTASGRYEVHELLRQYGHEKLARAPEELSDAIELHRRYYVARLEALHGEAYGGRQRWAAQQIDEDLENIRATIVRIAADGCASSPSHQAFWTLQLYFQSESRFTEGLTTFQRLGDAIALEPKSRSRDQAWIDVLVIQAWFRLRFGQIDHIDGLLDRTDALYRDLEFDDSTRNWTDPDIIRAHAELVRGNHDHALRFAERALDRLEQTYQRTNAQYAHNVTGRALLAAGSHDRAREHASRALAIAQGANDAWSSAYILNTLGEVELAAGDLAAAKRHFRQSHAIRSEFEDPEGTARALVLLATVAAAEGSMEEAGSEYERALGIYREVRDFGGLVTAHCGLADLSVAQGALGTARDHVLAALEIVSSRAMPRFTLTTLLSAAGLLLGSELRDRGLEIARFVRDHAASTQSLRAHARDLLEGHGGGEATNASQESLEAWVQRTGHLLAAEARDGVAG